MNRQADDLTTADLAEPTRDTAVESDRSEAEPHAEAESRTQAEAHDVEADADTVERERTEQVAEGANEGETDTQSDRGPLLPQGDAAEFQSRWEALQTSFVDEPRRAVQEGDTLVAELMQRLANSFAEERRSLEAQWDRGDDVSTEDLRVALQRYRSFFERLLST